MARMPRTAEMVIKPSFYSASKEIASTTRGALQDQELDKDRESVLTNNICDMYRGCLPIAHKTCWWWDWRAAGQWESRNQKPPPPVKQTQGRQADTRRGAAYLDKEKKKSRAKSTLAVAGGLLVREEREEVGVQEKDD